MALTDLTRISTSGIATGTSLSGAILHGDAHFRGTQVGVTSALFDSSDNALEFNDNVQLKFGNSGDLKLYHDGTDSVLLNLTGKIRHRSQVHIWKNYANSETLAKFNANGAVELYHDNVKKFETTTTGAVVTGIITASKFSGSLVGNTSNASGISTFYDLRVSNNLTVEGSTSTLDTTLIGVDRVEVGANSNTVVGVAVTQSGTADIVNLFDGATKVVTVDDVGQVGLGTEIPGEALHLGDNKKIALGYGEDVKIWHTGSESHITNSTGILRITGANGQKIDFYDGTNGYYARFNSGNSCELHFGGSGSRIVTKSYGAFVNGELRLTTGGNGYTFLSDPDTGIHNPSDGNLRLRVNGIDRLSMHTSGISTFHNQKIHIEGAGSGNTPLTINTDVASNNSVHPLIEAYSDNATYKTQIGLVREGSSGALGWGFFTNASGSPQERLRIDSSGRVMIGNTAAGQMYSGGDNLVIGTTSGENGITIISQSNSIGRILFSDSLTSGAATYQGQLNYNHSADELVLSTYTLGQIVMKTSNTERLRITSTGKFGFGGVTPGGTPANKNVFLAIGDSDTGIVQDGDGQLEIFGNGVEVVNFNAIDGYTSTKAISTTNNITIGDSIIHNGDTNTKIRFPTNDTITFETSGNEGLRIDANGNIGVNCTPATAGTLYSTVDHFLVIGDSDTGIAQDGDGQLELWTNNEEIANFNTSQVTLNKTTIINNSIGLGVVPMTGGTAAGFGSRTYKIAIGDSDSGIAQNGDGNICLYGNNAEVFRIDNYGNAGLGVAPRTAAGGVNNDTDVFLAIGDNDTGIAQDGDGQLEIWTNNQEIVNFNASYVTFQKDIHIPQWITHVGDSDSRFGFLQDNIIEFQVAGTQRLKIMNTGQIRIDQATSANNGIRMRPSGWSYDFRMGAVSSSGGSIWLGQNYDPTSGTRDSSTYGTNYLRFTTGGEIMLGTGATNTNPTERLKITNAGNVGVNNSNPTTTLNVKGTISTGRNVAREVGTATASASFSSSRDGENVINGKKNYENGSNDWLTPGHSRDNAYVTIDLGANYNISRAVIYNQNEYVNSRREVKGFTLEASTDNSNWTTVISDELGMSNGHEPNPGWSFRIPSIFNDDLEFYTARYWKFTMLTFHSSDPYGGIMEIELYEHSDALIDEVTSASVVAGDVYAETAAFKRITHDGGQKIIMDSAGSNGVDAGMSLGTDGANSYMALGQVGESNLPMITKTYRINSPGNGQSATHVLMEATNSTNSIVMNGTLTIFPGRAGYNQQRGYLVYAICLSAYSGNLYGFVRQLHRLDGSGNDITSGTALEGYSDFKVVTSGTKVQLEMTTSTGAVGRVQMIWQGQLLGHTHNY